MAYSNDWNFNDDNVRIPQEDDRTPEELDAEMKQRQKDTADLFLKEIEDWKENAMKILTHINDGGDFKLLGVRERSIYGEDGVDFRRVSMFKITQYCP